MSDRARNDGDAFFVGYLPAPRGLRGFLALVSVLILAAAAGVALAIAATVPDPGDGAVLGREDVEGVIRAYAYPLLQVTADSERLKAGQVVFLSALNKAGVADRLTPFTDQPVTVSALYTRRGDLTMLQLRFGPEGVAEREGEPPPPPDRADLGRWRLTGEICDGKCYAGAMRPGRGLSHKACAALCVLGGVPAVFVLAQPVEMDGATVEYLLITDADAQPAGPAITDLAAAFLTVEGRVERIGDLHVFRLEPETADVL
jgi:hypothetical protein